MDDETLACIKDLSDPHVNVRRHAVWRLGRLGDPETVAELVERLLDQSFDVRTTAANALRAIGDKNAVPGLADALDGEEDTEVRKALAKALGALKDRRAIPALARALDDDSTDVQNEVKEALLKFGKYAVPVFIEALGKGRNALPWIASRALLTLAQAHQIPLEDVHRELMRWHAGAQEEERELVRMSIAEIYRDIAAKVALQKKEVSDGGAISSGTIKPPKKPRMYRGVLDGTPLRFKRS